MSCEIDSLCRTVSLYIEFISILLILYINNPVYSLDTNYIEINVKWVHGVQRQSCLFPF